jgi:hypothetical protein
MYIVDDRIRIIRSFLRSLGTLDRLARVLTWAISVGRQGLAPDHMPPRWLDPEWPQQFHLDIMVDDVADATARVLELGARQLSCHVLVDPAGHPFCLVPRPSWAPPVAGDDTIYQSDNRTL